ARAAVGARDSVDNVLTPALHVVFRADGDGFEFVLRSDDVLHGVAEFLGQLTVRHEHESDHSQLAPVMAVWAHRFLEQELTTLTSILLILLFPADRAARALSCRRAVR